MLRSVTLPVADDVDLLAVYAGSSDPIRHFFRGRGADRIIVGLGVAAEITGDATGPDRFVEAARARVLLTSRLDASVTDDPRHAPLLVGGFAFDATSPLDDAAWADFGSYRMVLPRLLLQRRGGNTWATVTGSGALDARAIVESALAAAVAPDAPAGFRPNEIGDPSYPALVTDALAAIEAGDLDKVVTARRLRVEARIDPSGLAAALQQRFDNCATWAFATGDTTFVGATPELLVRVQRGRVETDALAGTRPRHPDPAEDAAIGQRLLADPKEQAEHRFVAEYLRRTLATAGVHLEGAREPSLRKLPGIQHLVTELSGPIAGTATTALALLRELHPSPAVGGMPRAEALAFLRRHEGLDRGWYAGPIGWLDLDGRGEFHVALRCALVQPDSITLYAGGGIVAGSDPDRETVETSVKMGAVFDSVGLDSVGLDSVGLHSGGPT